MDDEGRVIDKRKNIRNILSLLGEHKIKFVLTIIFIILSTLFTVISPILIGDAITIIYNGSINMIHHKGIIDFNALFNIIVKNQTFNKDEIHNNYYVWNS